MSCGCGCANCGTSTVPSVSGTEITVLSGLHQNSSPRSNGDENSNTSVYVIASALMVAGVAVFMTMRKG